jgi:hypothetical protein
MPEREWDVFISHAAEDKDAVAQPLADALRRSGVKVWLDRQELQLGDSLSEKIDEGLSKSHFGVVILSKAFFSKHWPRRELAGLRAREESGRKVILPIWHEINKAEVSEFSPILADALAATTANGIDDAATQVVRSVFSPSSGSPSATKPSLSRVLSTIMEGESDRNVMVNFVQEADRIVDMWHLFGPHERLFNQAVGSVTFDFLGLYAGHGVRYNFSLLTSIWRDPFVREEGAHRRHHHLWRSFRQSVMGEPQVLEEIRSILADILAAKRLFEDQWQMFHPRLLLQGRRGPSNERGSWFRDLLESKPECVFNVFCGRRAAIDRTDAHTAAWGRLRKEYGKSRIDIHSYDAILDAIVEHERKSQAN